MQRRNRREQGMTLIEVMVVMVIMAVLAGAASIGVMKSWNTSKMNYTQTRARTIQAAATAYILQEDGECPSVDDLARADVLDRTTDHKDGWGNPFSIDCDESTVHVHSAGADETLGNEDDIGF